MQFLIRRKIFKHYFLGYAKHEFKRFQHIKARLILLPEVPPDTPETNPFMRCIENKELPDFQAWTLKDSVNGAAKFALEYEGWLLEHFDKVTDPNNESLASPSFSDIMDPLERHCVQVDHAWQTFHQHFAMLYFGNENAENHAQGLHKLMTRITYFRFSTPGFYKILKEICKNSTDGWQRRLCEKYLLECHMNGLDLNARKAMQLGEIRKRYEEKIDEYRDHIASSEIKVTPRTVATPAELPDVPEHILRYLSDTPEGPIKLPITMSYTPSKYSLYLTYCKSRLARHGWWLQVNSRAAFLDHMILFNNSSLVEEMRQIRHREASWLGYKSYAELQLRVCMAKTVEEVNEFLTKFGEKASDRLDHLYEEMCTVAEVEGENTKTEPPDAWDLSYYARKVAKEKYKLNQHQFAEFFPYPQTIRNIFNYIGRLFGIEFRDVSQSFPRWHPTVEIFEIHNATTKDSIAYLYIDPYSRNKKCRYAFTMMGRPKSDMIGLKPVAYMNLALTPPTDQSPSLIYLDQLSTLAFELGRALQNVLSAAPYSHMVGDNLIEWDCKHVCARVMELLLARRPRVLTEISCHYQNGNKLGLETAQRYVTGAMTANLPTIVREVVDSELDLSLYSTHIFWRETYAKLHAKYLPYKWDKKKGDEFICNFGGYVTEKIAAKYFTSLWAKRLASDIVAAFDESGNETEFDISKRYLDVYLANGGRYSQAEAFKRFRGRDSILEPMFKYYVPS